MPDFICIGGQRTGTTWLHHVLSDNEAIWMPPCKELHHFDTISPNVSAYPYRYREHLGSRLRHYGLGLARAVSRRKLQPNVNLRLDWDWDLRYFSGISRGAKWYKGLFEVKGANGRITGEITPAYSLLPEAEITKIHEDLPDTKIILILRDPYKRAWSHALKDLPKEAAADHERMISFLRAPDCFDRSNWPEIIRRWRNVIPSEQMLVLDFEDIKQKPEAIITEVGEFVGADLTLPEETGGSLRERGSSTYKGGGIPDLVRNAIADVYDPIIDGTAENYPGIAKNWRSTG